MRAEQEIPNALMKNKSYSILVWRYKFGQFRIVLTDVTKPDAYAPIGHGKIVRELDTSDIDTLEHMLWTLQNADDPAQFCRTLERPWNCRSPVDRIHLDAEPQTNV